MIHGKHDLLEIALKSFQVGRGGMWVYYKSSLKKKKKNSLLNVLQMCHAIIWMEFSTIIP